MIVLVHFIEYLELGKLKEETKAMNVNNEIKSNGMGVMT